ncbi:lymphocyte antigen 75-like [Tachysurus vachellii]|uniref:lymphocyte antigen 75-like n=1 Tax=Tachysurus vachellii TaxID=175792 RepID=UPI00296ABF7C|nr:lymphocyte antigen 75-like [Tachysurus vachellii]
MKSIFFLFLLAAGCVVAVGLTKEYVFINSALQWNEAQTYCRQKYKDLATITTMKENNQLFPAPFFYSWIGLYNTLGTWEWSDGEQTSFFNWYDYPQSDCATILPYPYYGKWYSFSCTNSFTFYCYQFLILVKEKKTWEEAQEFCETQYTGLASVSSSWSLEQLIQETVGTETESVWTGLHFMDGQWLWVNEEQTWSQTQSQMWSVIWSPMWSQTQILVSMPSCPAQSYRCGALNTTSNTMKNHNCNERLNFICYWT